MGAGITAMYVWSGRENWRWEWQRPFNVLTDSLSLTYLHHKQIPPVIGYETEFLAGPEAEQELLRCIPGNAAEAEYANHMLVGSRGWQTVAKPR